jgi:hypothetical protein
VTQPEPVLASGVRVSVANDRRVTYAAAYQAVRLRRRAELQVLMRTATDNNPWTRFLLGGFFAVFGATMFAIFPPLGFIGILVGAVCGYAGFGMLRARQKIKRTLDDENMRWNIRDSAVEKLGEQGFETLASAVEAQGSYESVTGWMKRKDMTEEECNTLILAAAVSGEERAQMIAARDAAIARGSKGRTPGERPGRGASPEGAFGPHGTGDEDSLIADGIEGEGLHARLMREAEGDADAGRPGRKPGPARPPRGPIQY